ncbi:hypothetical protein [Castellaniella sp.]|uniref:hypothetical protein n=1 Tax=Castellaniella sp. TaxID=1955812 RepID=UPI003C728BEC
MSVSTALAASASMDVSAAVLDPGIAIAGVRIRGVWSDDDQARCRRWLSDHGLGDLIVQDAGADEGPWQRFRLSWPPATDLDTIGLAQALRLSPDESDRDLDAEILAALLLSPVSFDFPSLEEWQSAVRLRRFIVQAGRRTVLAFDTEQAERPDCWRWSEATGFILLPGHDLIPSLEQTLWPDVSGRLYSFSCYRATEYVLLLALAQELRISNPAALAALQAQWQRKAIQSGPFHDAFLHEYGSLQAPLPPRYYVPGDRLWFRNPHEPSANVEGYEGSWVFYLGQGHFTNFWKPGQPYTLTYKCVEIYHWRHGLRQDAVVDPGAPAAPAPRIWMDESIVEARVAGTLADPLATNQVLDRMMRLRDPAGVYDQGGCIDASREAVRCVRPGTFDLAFQVSQG